MKAIRTALSLLLSLLLVFALCGMTAALADMSDEEISAKAAEISTDAFHIVCDVCPINVAFAKNIKCDIKDDIWTYTFDSFYGPFRYVIDAASREVTESEEPDIEAARAQEGFVEPMEYDDLLDKIFDQCPVTLTQTRGIVASLSPDEKLNVSFDSAYGPFAYVVDPFTGDILERTEPDIQAVMADPDFQERLAIDELLGIVFDQCPIDITTARNIKPSLRADDRWAISFGSAYGDFLYIVDPYGEILEITEPDMEAAREQEGFLEPLSTEEILDAVFDNCPIDITMAKEIKPKPGNNDTWNVTFGSDYGEFIYVVDAYTGEILERTEPDMEAARAQEGFVEPLAITDIMNKVFAASPIRVDQMQDIRPSQRADGTWAVTFESESGSFLYVVDGTTGEILEKTEPALG